MPSLTDHLLALETRTMDIKQSGDWVTLASLIADDFVEIGSSGRLYNRSDALAALRNRTLLRYTIHDFHVRELAPGVALALYRIEIEAEYPDRTVTSNSHRSSLWVERNGSWQITSHQGTTIPA